MNKACLVEVTKKLSTYEVTGKSLCDYLGKSSFHLSKMLKLVLPIFSPALTNVNLCFDAVAQCSKSIFWCMETMVLTQPLLYNMSLTCTNVLSLLHKVPTLYQKSAVLINNYVSQMAECLLQLSYMTNNVNLAVQTLYCLGSTAPQSDSVLQTFQWFYQLLHNCDQIMKIVIVLAENMDHFIVKARRTV